MVHTDGKLFSLKKCMKNVERSFFQRAFVLEKIEFKGECAISADHILKLNFLENEGSYEKTCLYFFGVFFKALSTHVVYFNVPLSHQASFSIFTLCYVKYK